MKNLKSRRGFSLVELMVVVAIMGTLAAIAIPAYNEYRKSAKKTAYRSDLLSLHKGWLAFGVELDSFCERETVPAVASINNVGMQSLFSSKLYGLNGNLFQCVRAAPATPCATATLVTETAEGGFSLTTPTCTTGCQASTLNGTGPGKHNFIGFGGETCAGSLVLAQAQIRGFEGNSQTTEDAACIVDETSYEMGVYGHLSGTEYFGVSVNHNGVISAEETTVFADRDTADSGC